KKVIRIGPAGDGDAAPAAAHQAPAAAPGGAPVRVEQQTTEPERRRPKSKNRSGSSLADDELGPGQERYAALAPGSAGGVLFVIDGADADASVDRFAFVPGYANIDSTYFAFSKDEDAAAGESSAAA